MLIDVIYLANISTTCLKLDDHSRVTPTDIDGKLFIGHYIPYIWYGRV